MAVIADMAGTKKGEMLSWFSSVTIIGNLLGAPLGGLILHSSVGAAAPSIAEFHHAYLASGVAGVLSLGLALSILRGDKKTGSGIRIRAASLKFISSIKEVLTDKRVVITSAMEGLQNMTMGALEAFLPIYAAIVAGVNEFQVGILWGVQIVTTILSKPAMGTFGTIFDIGHASGPILAGFLIVRYDYLYSFGAMAVTLLLVAPVFILMVKEK
jgi:MFS family permease